MAGFYGNISTSNRSAFTFDKVYANRRSMDKEGAGDGVFLGRYVLVEYDDPPLQGYYSQTKDEFYSDPHYSESSRAQPLDKIENHIYQDLSLVSTAHSFYVCEQSAQGNKLTYKPLSNASSGYAANYNLDVVGYGRGYDSTVWMKTIDPNNNKYRYVLVAELNTVVPHFHLVMDPPSGTPYGPYFDNATTSLDYYMHIQTPYAHRLNTQPDAHLSDEKIEYVISSYNPTSHTWVSTTKTNQPGDIFYNKLGFRQDVRSYVTEQTASNSINYTLVSSGNKIYGTDNAAINDNGITAKDTYLWSIHLPVLGNTICTIWDLLYTTDRKLELLKESGANRDACTIDTDSIFGTINSARCFIGQVYAMPVTRINDTDTSFIVESSDALGVTGSGGTLTFNKAILFKDDGEDVRHYYYPNYTNKWIASSTGEYYLDNGVYKLANKAALPAGTQYYKRDQGDINPHWRYTLEYTDSSFKMTSGEAAIVADRATLNGAPHTIYGALAQVNRMLGINLSEADSRDDRTLIGMMNRVKDMIQNIDTQLSPKKLLGTDKNGKISTTNIIYPYAGTGDHQELLDSSGTWRLPVTYKLETLNLRNAQDNTKYFDAGYYGNSCLHAVLASDTLGEAIKKMQNEMADIQYVQQAITKFSVNLSGGESTLLENGAAMNSATLTYTLNKGPRKSIEIKRVAPEAVTILSTTNINPEFYVTNAEAYARSAADAQNDTNILSGRADTTMTWTISVTDERDYTATQTVNAFWCNRYYYGVGAAITNLATVNTRAKLDSLITGGNKLARNKAGLSLSLAPHANEYMFYMQPKSWTNPTFKIGGFEGGMDLLGEFNFTNANGYTTTYKLWQSTNANLGATTLVIS